MLLCWEQSQELCTVPGSPVMQARPPVLIMLIMHSVQDVQCFWVVIHHEFISQVQSWDAEYFNVLRHLLFSLFHWIKKCAVWFVPPCPAVRGACTSAAAVLVHYLTDFATCNFTLLPKLSLVWRLAEEEVIRGLSAELEIFQRGTKFMYFCISGWRCGT